MSQAETAFGLAGHRDDGPVDQGRASELGEAASHRHGAGRRRRVAPLVAGSISCVVALVFVAGGGWGLWKAIRPANESPNSQPDESKGSTSGGIPVAARS